MLYAGIVGLPNVGKSTLFNALTKSEVMSGNFMFSTTTANIGVVELEDTRLDVLAEIHKSRKTIPTSFELVDVPALVSGSSSGEGLGNQFLVSIRNVDAICHVIRCFIDENVIHVSDKLDPLNDIETIQLELNYADLDSIQKRLPRLEKKAKLDANSTERKEFDILKRLEEALENDLPIRRVSLTEDEEKIIKSYHFLSQKPMLFIANVSEDDFADLNNNKLYNEILTKAKTENVEVIPICASLEYELGKMEKAEQVLFLDELGIDESGISKLEKAMYKTLGLSTFFTAGETQTKAWTFANGLTARKCAGIIHSDFERGFIRAEVVNYEDLSFYGNYQKCKEAGKVRLEGRDYLVMDGDVIVFRFNV